MTVSGSGSRYSDERDRFGSRADAPESVQTRRASMRRFLLLFPMLTFGQVTPEVTTNVQLENFVFYVDQHGDATRIGTLPGPVPMDPQLGVALRRYAIVADVVSVGGRPAAGTFLAHGIVVSPS